MSLHRFLLLLWMFFPLVLCGQEPVFTVVLDPGHGGKDPGACVGRTQEKNIVLPVALKVGALIQANHPKDIKLIYTRKTDVFVELKERANIANQNKADIFISIHADAAESTNAYGAGTFTMELTKIKANLELAKRENSVLLLEDDYQQKYEGFEPSSTESYIMFEMMKDVNMENSTQLATLIQRKFVNKGRHNRDVRQAPFLVLYRTTMPSVLVELGFLSNAEERKYLNSEKGQNELAACIYEAIDSYKRKKDVLFGENGLDLEQNLEQNVEQNVEPVKSIASNDIDYRVQIFAAKKVLPDNDPEFKKLKTISYYQEGSTYKYTYGHFSTEIEAKQANQEIKKLFADAFVVAFKEGKRIPLDEARKQTKK